MAHRCHICDRTNDKRLTTVSEQYYKGPFHKDERYTDLDICEECQEAITETLYDYEDENDDYTDDA